MEDSSGLGEQRGPVSDDECELFVLDDADDRTFYLTFLAAARQVT